MCVAVILETNKRKIKVNNTLLQIMRQYIQFTHSDTEAGGILVGRENISDSNLIIEHISTPLPNDIRTRCRYIRKDEGHIDFYNQLYRDTNGIYAYVGEWHTHPEDVPRYSIIDLKNWKRIAKEHPMDKQYHFIIGRQQIAIWEMNKKQIKPILIGMVDWNEKFLQENSSEC